MVNDETAVLTVAEVAARLAQSPRNVRRMCDDGRLAGAHRDPVDGTWRVPVTSVGRQGQPAKPGQQAPRHGMDVEAFGQMQATLDGVLAQLAQAQANTDRYRDEAARARSDERIADFKREKAEARAAELEAKIEERARRRPDVAGVVSPVSVRPVRWWWPWGRHP